MFILNLVTLREALLFRTFDPHKNLIKAGPYHKFHQLLVICEVDGGLGEERERIFLLLHPFYKGG